MPTFFPLLRTTLPLLAFFLVAACDSGETDGPGRDDDFAAGCDTSSAIPVAPRGTYLRAEGEDDAELPTRIRLADEGVSPGDSLILERLGEFQFTVNRDPDATRDGLVGVFSATAEILAKGQLDRVPGAIPAGQNFVTRVSYPNGLATDIPEDFLIDSTTVVVPAGAEYLFLSPHDDKFEDNLDGDQDFRVCLVNLNE